MIKVHVRFFTEHTIIYVLYLPKQCKKMRLFSILLSMVSIATFLFKSLVISLLILKPDGAGPLDIAIVLFKAQLTIAS